MRRWLKRQAALKAEPRLKAELLWLQSSSAALKAELVVRLNLSLCALKLLQATSRLRGDGDLKG